MDSTLAWDLIRVAGELQELLSRLKEQCRAEEYRDSARVRNGRMHTHSSVKACPRELWVR